MDAKSIANTSAHAAPLGRFDCGAGAIAASPGRRSYRSNTVAAKSATQMIFQIAITRRAALGGQFKNAPPCLIAARLRSPPRPGERHVDFPAAAPGTDQPLAPIEHRVSAPYRAAILARSDSTRWPQARHQTISRTWFAAALPSVIGEPGADFTPRRPRPRRWGFAPTPSKVG